MLDIYNSVFDLCFRRFRILRRLPRCLLLLKRGHFLRNICLFLNLRFHFCLRLNLLSPMDLKIHGRRLGSCCLLFLCYLCICCFFFSSSLFLLCFLSFLRCFFLSVAGELGSFQKSTFHLSGFLRIQQKIIIPCQKFLLILGKFCFQLADPFFSAFLS